MSSVSGVRVTVESDLPQEVVARISEAVRAAVLNEVAQLDLAPPLREVPLLASDFAADTLGQPGFENIPFGIWLRDGE